MFPGFNASPRTVTFRHRLPAHLSFPTPSPRAGGCLGTLRLLCEQSPPREPSSCTQRLRAQQLPLRARRPRGKRGKKHGDQPALFSQSPGRALQTIAGKARKDGERRACKQQQPPSPPAPPSRTAAAPPSVTRSARRLRAARSAPPRPAAPSRPSEPPRPARLPPSGPAALLGAVPSSADA